MKYFLSIIFLFLYSKTQAQSIVAGGPTTICGTGNVLLSVAGAAAGATFQWQNNGANISGQTGINFTAASSGSYGVIITNSTFPDTLATIIVAITQPPVVDFSFDATASTCADVPVNFITAVSNGTPPFTYKWTFGDGGSSASNNPSHPFNSVGCGTATFTTTLTVTDVNGCAGTVSKSITVKQSPDVQLSDLLTPGTPFSNCANDPSPTNPNYTISVGNISPGSSCILNYSINWGDGTSENNLTFPINHTYTSLGAFNMAVTALGSNGCSHTKSYVVANQKNPDIGIGTFGLTEGCAPIPVNIVISAWPNNSPGTTYSLNFGDGQDTIFTHPINPAYTNDTIVHAYTTTSCPNLPVFSISMSATNACRTKTFVGGDIVVKIKPQSDFIILTSPSCVGKQVCFNNISKTGFDVNCSVYGTTKWNFGDPSSGANDSSTQNSPCHTYAEPGVYTVTLTTLNICGPSTITHTVCITPKPLSGFTIDQNTGCGKLAVATINTTNSFNGCAGPSYKWRVDYTPTFCGTTGAFNFTNNTNDASINPSFLFINPGTYSIVLLVTSPCGTDSIKQTVIIKQPPQVTIDPIIAICTNGSIDPSAIVSTCTPNTPVQYSWVFTDGLPAAAITLIPGNIIYSTPGIHPIQLSVTNECGTTTATASVSVTAPPVVKAGNDTTLCRSDSSILLNANPIGGQWSGTPFITAAGVFTPSAPGSYQVIYTFGAGSCVVADTVVITVNPGILNNSISPNQSICINTQPAAINGLQATGGGSAAAYQWQSSIDSLNWVYITGETGINYLPPALISTIFYRRIAFTTLCAGAAGSFSTPVKITVNNNSKASFTANSIVGCIPFNVGNVITVTPYPDRNSLYQWFADSLQIGNNTTGIFPGYTMVLPNDSILIKLVTSSPFGCKPDSIQQQFNTKIIARAKFTKDTSGGCGPVTVAFTNTTDIIAGTQFNWNFGNGITSNIAQPLPVTYTSNPPYTDTVYQVTLSAFNGCDTTFWRDSVKIKANARARFGVDTTYGCSPFTVHINNTSLGGSNTYYWNFGNGHFDTTFTNAPLVYTYNSGNKVDTFTIQLIAVNQCNSDTQTINIRVAPINIVANINLNSSDLFGCAPHNIAINNNSSGASTFVWYFGDGTPLVTTNENENIVPHTYTDTGSFTIKVIMSNGCSDTTVYRSVTVYTKPTAGFSTNKAIYCAGDSVRVSNISVNATNYQWLWGDGTITTGANPTHVYTAPGNFTIYLRAEKTNSSGLVCYDTAVNSITILGKPIVTILSNIGNLNCAPFTLQVSAPGIISENTDWYFFDSTSIPASAIKNGASANYTFTKPGNFYVKLLAQNNAGCGDSTIIPFTVQGMPVANFTPTNLSVCTTDTTVAYVNTSTYNGNDAVRYNWQVNGVSISGNGNFSYRYTANPSAILPHTFITALIVSNTAGCSDTARATLQLNPHPKAQFSIENTLLCVPFLPVIINTSQYTNNYQWLLNGVLVSSAANPVIPITKGATFYTLSLICNNIYGCKPDTFTVTFTSRIKPIAAFTISDTLGCTGTLNVATTNTSVNANNFSWDWGDDTQISHFTNPGHVYNNTGQYLISLVVTDGSCSDTAGRIVKVGNKPLADFAVNTTITCGTASVQFINQTTNGDTYLWSFGDDTFSNEVNPSKSYAPRNIPYTVKLVAYAALGCKDSAVKANLILAKVTPAANFFISPTPEITVPAYTFSFNNLTLNQPNYQYLWSLGDGSAAVTRDVLNHKYADTGTYPIKLIVFDNQTNCSDTIIKLAHIGGFPGWMYIPNAICPNCLQENLRTFLPKAIGLKEYHLQIFTTWGEMVFESTSLDSKGSPNQPWNATYLKGGQVVQDAYVWKIQAKFINGSEWLGMIYPGETKYKKAGSITVVR